MNAEIATLRDRVAAMETRDSEINAQVARLREVLDQATALLSRNSADLGTKVGKTEQDLALLGGQIEEAKHLLAQLERRVTEDQARIASLEQTQGKIIDRVAPTIPEDKETLWREAQQRLAGGMREDGRRFLRSFVQRFPADPRAPQALIAIGQSFAVEGRHTQAVAEYQTVLDKHPRAAEVPDAMYLLGVSFVELKFCAEARGLLNDLLKRYPRSGRAEDTRAKLRDLAKIAKDKRLCTT